MVRKIEKTTEIVKIPSINLEPEKACREISVMMYLTYILLNTNLQALSSSLQAWL